MNILFINNGETRKTRPRDIIKKYLPQISDRFKAVAPLVTPRPILRRMVGGFGVSEKRFPLGLGYLSAMLRQEGHNIDLVDRFADPEDWPDNPTDYDFIGVYVSTPCYEDALATVRRLEAENYTGPLAFGGPHASTFPETIPTRVDYVVQGEAEYIINDLVQGKYPSGCILRTPRIKDLDSLPRTDYALFMERKRSYQFTLPFSDRGPIFNMNTSRSCPMACSFCTVRDIWGRIWRSQSAERILDDILFLQRDYAIEGVYFREDFFPASKKRVRRICELLLKHNVNIVWACETRADAACDSELVRLMARAGCVGFYIGAESGSQRMLDHYNKQIQVEQIIRACALAKKNNIGIIMSLIIAHPKETQRDRIDTWKLVRTARPEILYVNAYRDEFTRHGSIAFPRYPLRKCIDIGAANNV